MSEWTILWLASAKLVLLSICATLYSIGGRDGTSKGIRRFINPLVLCGGIYGLAFRYTDLWFALALVVTYGLLAFGYSLGYGGQTLGLKIVRRTKCALAITLAGLPLAVVGGSYTLFFLQVVIGVCVMVTLGVLNPVEAAEEEILIGLSTIMFVPFYV